MDNNKMDDNTYENEEYRRFKEHSLKGESGRRTGEIVRIKKSTYRHNMKVIAAATAIAVSLVIGGGLKVYNHAKDNTTLYNITYDFYREVIVPETHRTANNQYYYYDYNDIADRIESMEDPDLGYFLFYNRTGRNQTDKVMQETIYGSFDTYLAAHGYEDAKEFEQDMTRRAILTQEIRERESELQTLSTEHPNLAQIEAGTYGGGTK